MINTILFDFDGTLADSEQANIEAGTQTFRNRGMALTEEEKRFIIGKSSLDYVPAFLKARGVVDAGTYRLVVEELRENYDALWPSVVALMPGVEMVIPALRARGKRLGIVTTNRRATVEKFFAKFGFADAFGVVVASEDVERRKPYPDGYRLATRRLIADPGKTGGVEDTTNGVIAINAAGLRSFAVPNEHTRHHDFSAADHVLGSLEGLLKLA